MHRLREAQFEALRRAWLRSTMVDRVLAELQSLELLPPEPDPDEPPDPSEAGPAVRELVEADLLGADDDGVRGEDGLVKFAGYRWEFGADWRERPAVRAAIDRARGNEGELLRLVEAALAGGETEG